MATTTGYWFFPCEPCFSAELERNLGKHEHSALLYGELSRCFAGVTNTTLDVMLPAADTIVTRFLRQVTGSNEMSPHSVFGIKLAVRFALYCMSRQVQQPTPAPAGPAKRKQPAAVDRPPAIDFSPAALDAFFSQPRSLPVELTAPYDELDERMKMDAVDDEFDFTWTGK